VNERVRELQMVRVARRQSEKMWWQQEKASQR